MNVAELRHVSKIRKDFSITDLNFPIPKGFITGFIGPNGSGKTTTIQLMMNLLRLDDGEITIFGKNHTNHRVKQKIGFVYDDLNMYEEYTIKKLKAIMTPLYETWNDTLFESYIEKFNLPLNKKLKHFSRGMKMKCSLLFALAHDPEFLIMDEPTAGLDPIFRRELLDMLQEWMVEGNRSIFLSTHMTTDLDRVADYIIFINKGKIIFKKSMEEVGDRFYVINGKKEVIDADTRQLFHGLQMTDVGFKGLFEGDVSIWSPYENELIIEEASLEDIMFYTTRSVSKNITS